jgi:Zn-dependent protease
MLDLSSSVLISRILTLLIAFTAHEYAHGRVAELYGDDTPRLAGRLTLNPLSHLDPIGTLLLILFGFGWAKPVPINPEVIRRKSKAGVMVVSLAGPFSNFFLALVGAIPLRFFGVSPFLSSTTNIFPTLGQFLVEFIFLNLTLWLFNLLPFAPLDGEKVLEYLLPESAQPALASIRPYGIFILLALIYITPLLGFDLFTNLIGIPVLNITRFLIGI